MSDKPLCELSKGLERTGGPFLQSGEVVFNVLSVVEDRFHEGLTIYQRSVQAMTMAARTFWLFSICVLSAL